MNGLNEKIERASDFEELASFLARMNVQRESHIGYCGDQAEEIRETFIEEEMRFVVARNEKNEIVAAMGLDIDETSAEVWGPFNQTSSTELQTQLWERLVS